VELFETFANFPHENFSRRSADFGWTLGTFQNFPHETFLGRRELWTFPRRNFIDRLLAEEKIQLAQKFSHVQTFPTFKLFVRIKSSAPTIFSTFQTRFRATPRLKTYNPAVSLVASFAEKKFAKCSCEERIEKVYFTKFENLVHAKLSRGWICRRRISKSLGDPTESSAVNVWRKRLFLQIFHWILFHDVRRNGFRVEWRESEFRRTFSQKFCGNIRLTIELLEGRDK
jgi:hypothetical protein